MHIETPVNETLFFLNIKIGPFGGKTICLRADNTFRFFQVYNPKEDIIAVEPVTSNINALNTGDELIVLEKGEVNVHRIEITLDS